MMKQVPSMVIAGKDKPILAAAPHGTGKPVQFQPDAHYPLVLDHAHVAAAEAFSILRSRLLSVHSKQGIRSVLITSAEVGEGKTLIAVNLALSLGQLDKKRVLFVDGDLRACTATSLLNLRSVPGLSEFLVGKKPYEAVVHATAYPSLSVLPAGEVPEKSLPQILEGWPELLGLAKQQFDLIIVDCLPAAAPVADLELMAAACDAVLPVVQMRKTTRESIARLGTRLDRTKFLGVLINNADELYDYNYSYYSYGSRKKK